MRRFRYSLRGLLLVTTLLAISFSLIRTCTLHYPDEPEDWQWICFCVGVHLLVCTVGGAVGYLVGARRGAAFGAALFVLLSWVVSIVVSLPVIY
jgi:hypothetical protein